VSPSQAQLCERARHWASLRVDGELSELEAALLDSHLGRCPSCRTFADEAHAIASALRAVPLDRLEAPVTIALGPRPRRTRALQTAVAVALVLVAAALGSALGVVSRSTSTPAPTAKHVAMVAATEDADQLRKLRRPVLVYEQHPIPRNRLLPGDA
jgi:predicted anti-sigma-YlaC factor YlaD